MMATMTTEQVTRVESERPLDGVPIPTESAFELAAYRMPNGSKFVTLTSDSELCWEAYCAEIVRKSVAK